MATNNSFKHARHVLEFEKLEILKTIEQQLMNKEMAGNNLQAATQINKQIDFLRARVQELDNAKKALSGTKQGVEL